MTTKLIYTAIGNGTNRVAKVRLNRDYDEYAVYLFIGGVLQIDATYFTDDFQDAKDTADCMANELLL